LDQEYYKKCELIQQDYKQNKEKVIDYLIDNIMNVAIELPENIKKGNLNE
jgi:hypothetical protein